MKTLRFLVSIGNDRVVRINGNSGSAAAIRAARLPHAEAGSLRVIGICWTPRKTLPGI